MARFEKTAQLVARHHQEALAHERVLVTVIDVIDHGQGGLCLYRATYRAEGRMLTAAGVAFIRRGRVDWTQCCGE